MILLLLFHQNLVILLIWKEYLKHKHILVKEVILINLEKKLLKLIQIIKLSKNYYKELKMIQMLKQKKWLEYYMKQHLLIQVFYYIVYLGYSIPSPEKFATRFYKLFNSALGIDRDAPIKEYEVEIEEEP